MQFYPQMKFVISPLNFVKKSGVVIFSGNPNNDVKLSKNQISSVLRKEIIIKVIKHINH